MSKHSKNLIAVAIVISCVFFCFTLWITDGEKLTMQNKTEIAFWYFMVLFISVFAAHLFTLVSNDKP